VVGRGLLAELPRALRERCPARAYAVISDSCVAELYGSRVLGLLRDAGLEARLFPFPNGEWNKTRETWAELTDAMLKARVGRDGAVVALGGGVAGDLAGFVAATYLRGVPHVQVPTTLLAMIDASIGGKTGVDVPAGKNLVGAFHQPSFVLADIETLATLPKPHVSAGMAEALKHAVVADAAYLDALLADAALIRGKDLAALERVVTRSIAIKSDVVAADPLETGRRQILNFGHTVGHAVEARSGYALLHGEAVAVGMAVEASLAESLGIAERGLAAAVRAALERFGLPVRVPDDLAADDLLEAMQSDKKVRARAVRFALPTRVGEMLQRADGAWTVDVEPQEILQAIIASR
jgi:3-dehydroquinate synthase